MRSRGLTHCYTLGLYKLLPSEALTLFVHQTYCHQTYQRCSSFCANQQHQCPLLLRMGRNLFAIWPVHWQLYVFTAHMMCSQNPVPALGVPFIGRSSRVQH